MLMLYYSSRVKSVLTLNIAYFLTLFVRKCLDRANEKVKSLKIENFDETSKMRTLPNSGKFWLYPLVSAAIQRFDFSKKKVI